MLFLERRLCIEIMVRIDFFACSSGRILFAYIVGIRAFRNNYFFTIFGSIRDEFSTNI